jgi:hypothetical protein
MGNNKSRCNGDDHSQPAFAFENSLEYLTQSLMMKNFDICATFKQFQKFDIHSSGVITYEAYCNRLGCKPKDNLMKYVFMYFGANYNNGEQQVLNFPAYILFTHFFMTLDEIGLQQFLYIIIRDKKFHRRIFDNKMSFANLIDTIVGRAWSDKLKDELIEMQNNQELTIGTFLNLCKRNPQCIAELLKFQCRLRQYIITPQNAKQWSQRLGLGNQIVDKINQICYTLQNSYQREIITEV